MQNLSGLTLLDWVSALAGPAPVPAGGALSLVTLAGAASLAEKVLRISGRDSSGFEGLARLFLYAASEDGSAYVSARREGAQGAQRCLEAGLRHLETTLDLLRALSEAFEDVSPPLAADLAAAGRLSRAAGETLLANLAVNLTEWGALLPGAPADDVRRRLSDLKQKLESV